MDSTVSEKILLQNKADDKYRQWFFEKFKDYEYYLPIESCLSIEICRARHNGASYGKIAQTFFLVSRDAARAKCRICGSGSTK